MSETTEKKATAKKATAKKETSKKATAKKATAKKEAETVGTVKKSTRATAQEDTVKKDTVKKPSTRKRASAKVEVVDTTDAETVAADEPIIIEDSMAPLVVDSAAGSGTGSGTGKSKERHGGFLNMLYRHPRDRMLAGVCGGIADYIGWDPVLVRVFWAVATLMTGGGGLLAYLALALLLPVGTKRDGFVRPGKIEMTEQNLGRASYGLIGLGIVWLLSNMGILSILFRGASAVIGLVFWPALFIVAGLVLLNRNGDKNYRASLNNGWSNVRERANSVRTSGKMPNSGNIRSSFISFRESMPIKRSRNNRMLAGVCGGIGRAVGIDANLVRLGFAILSIGTAGTPMIAYVMLAILLPSERKSSKRANSSNEDDVTILDGTANVVDNA